MPARIRIGAARTIIESDDEADAQTAAAFAANHALVLHDVFTADVQSMLARALAETSFVPDNIAVDGARLHEQPRRTGPLLCFLLNRSALRDWLARVTGIAPLASVGGETARFLAGGGQHLDWHNDQADARRMLGVTVNLSTAPYEGGRFEMKRRGSDVPLLVFDHALPNTALVFRIGPKLMHRVTPVTAGGPRTVFGGWFFSTLLGRD